MTAWRRTGLRVFNLAARVDGAWWVLRFNDFPDHPLTTLFVNGEVVGDVDGGEVEAVEDAELTSDERDEIRTLMRGLGPYGSEIGSPCDGDWCCFHRTDEFVGGS